MRASGFAIGVAAGVIFLAIAAGVGRDVRAAESAEAKEAAPAAPKFENEMCLGCHGNEGFSAPGANGKTRSLHVVKDKFGKSVHAKRFCVECHKDITEIPHEKGVTHKVGCVECHEDRWKTAQKDGKEQQFARLGVVVEQIEHYMKSIHARPSKADQSRTNATCYNCHDAHYVYPKDSPGRAEWRLSLPDVCGKCHSAQRTEYLDSVHGRQVMGNANPAAPVCSDCHTTHDVDRPKLDAIKLVITRNCGKCHAGNLKSYANTYHGQVTTLGYAYTATCFACHGSHGIQRVSHPRSTVHPNNRLKTCQQCHKGATAGFVSFQPHANTHDFARYPAMWIAAKAMIALLIGVFAFFWAHSALWFYREYRDRKEGKSTPHVAMDAVLRAQGRQYQRFGGIWRIAHLAFAVSVMMLVLTGMSVLFADSAWAPAFMKQLGSPKVSAIMHRTAAAIMLGIFFVHLVYMALRVVPKWSVSDWFGPHSLVPSWKDLSDAVAMFKWFFGQAPRPVFDRWTYWEKFDYWAVFWGMAIIGGSGMMLAFPEATASVLPGWIFNIATLVHGEEAILAAVFLFTVHFFNNHFRPDKLPPPDIVMFTGSVPLEEFRREHTLEYNRLVESRQLEKHLVDAPSQQMALGSRVLGIALIAFGLILLVLVLAGVLGGSS
ncbi:MAG: cytochrome C [Betaproteobacteria bacterium RIFCSPLOWO2_02_64_14]|nr:MAG: cytochrome C [Betaproteobacteria bacterium RIFCSPLOWO2_02_64_14]